MGNLEEQKKDSLYETEERDLVSVDEQPHHRSLLFSLFAFLSQLKSLLLTMLPFILFGLLYNSMRYCPNYLFGDIDIRGIYETEREWFGIGILTPNEWWAVHATPVLDFLAGCFYLMWVPLPVVFGIWLFFTGRRELCFRYSCAFLFINILGFIGYYLHPAAPPWYVAKFGFDPLFDTGGDAAGLVRFDALIGLPVFQTIYSGNSNVFAAVPSLHAAYCPVAAFYALKAGDSWWSLVLGIFSIGIWWTAVYSAHHYVIDVLLGILVLILGLILFERMLMRWLWWQAWMRRYVRRLK